MIVIHSKASGTIIQAVAKGAAAGLDGEQFIVVGFGHTPVPPQRGYAVFLGGPELAAMIVLVLAELTVTLAAISRPGSAPEVADWPSGGALRAMLAGNRQGEQIGISHSDAPSSDRLGDARALTRSRDPDHAILIRLVINGLLLPQSGWPAAADATARNAETAILPAVSRSESRDPARHRRENALAMAARPPHMRPAPRPCLHCRRPFDSAHAGNRICAKCRDMLMSDGTMALPS